MQVRKALPIDFTLLAELGAVTFRETYSHVTTEENLNQYINQAFSPQEIKEELEDIHNTFFIVFQEGEPIAYAKLNARQRPDIIADKKIIQIQRIYARQRVLGKGVGGVLMQRCIEEAQQMGADLLWLTVWQQNSRAIEFYKKWGFKVIGEKKFCVGNKEFDDYLMCLELNDR
jgi:ribosomal protein S18 acetylase RimI-like enzyme